jgi:hypothetical protein
MELEEIEIFIEKDGRVRIEVRGAKGMACLDLTRELEAALGGAIELREFTPEAYSEGVEVTDQDLEQLKGGHAG